MAKPRFHIGELVRVISVRDENSRTIGRVLSRFKVGNTHFYKISGVRQFVPESQIEKHVNQSGNTLKPQFNFGDKVRVAGYEGAIYVVREYRLEEYHSPLSITWEICYLLEREDGDEILEAYAEDMELVEEGEPVLVAGKADNIDRILDAINDYKRLYEMFGDNEYLEKANELRRGLKNEED